MQHWRLALLVTAAGFAAAVMLFFPDRVFAALGWINQENVSELAARAGLWGPVVIVGLMTVAVVFSPIPSAPIALASGAVYGHAMGAVFVVIGAESGALIAFGLARVLGRDTMRRWFGDRPGNLGLLGSQNVLMWIVFASRLMPFVSFDLVSYAAGLSNLNFWRFALATFAGIIPASVLLAHFGGEMARGGLSGALWLALGLGLITGLPVLWGLMRRWRSGA